MKSFASAVACGCLFLAMTGCSPSEDANAPVAVSAAGSAGFDRLSGTEDYTFLISGTRVGQLAVVHDDVTKAEYEYRNNGRGPTFHEEIGFDAAGFPVNWTITGNSNFGNAIDERFSLVDGVASWTDTTGSGSAAVDAERLYVAQEGSPYQIWLYARLLLTAPGRTLPILPAGELHLEEIETLDLAGTYGPIPVTTFAISGITTNPVYLALDADRDLFAVMGPTWALIRAGFESFEEQMRDLAVEYGARRFEDIQKQVTHRYDKPVRVNNVRVFDPVTLALTGYSSVLVDGNRIAAVEPVLQQANPGEVTIDGAGGTLIAGMYEMHAHLNQSQALLNVAAGVTSVRDMGSNNAVLSDLIAKFDSGRLVGPRVIRSGFIEGVSPFNNSSYGILVSSEAEAVEAVRTYASGEIGNYWQVKIYSSINPDWIPAVIREARAHGLRVAGHVPAFTNADAMIAAGYDEMTHANQVMLGWVLEPGEDTRTLLRLTAQKRLPGLTMDDPRVQRTLNAMVERGVAIDPSFESHEFLLLSRNGVTSPGFVDFVDHLPIGDQRNAKSARAEIASPEDDTAYRGAWEVIKATLTEMYRKGIFMVPGTDLSGPFIYHRELELYQEIGMTPAEILKMATLDMAAYLEQDSDLGSIAPGKLADFFLVPGNPVEDLKSIKSIAMVVKDGTVFFPSEIYPAFGIRPFVDAPLVMNE